MKPAVLMCSVTAGVSRSHKISSGGKWNIKNNIDPVYVLVGDLSPTSKRIWTSHLWRINDPAL